MLAAIIAGAAQAASPAKVKEVDTSRAAVKDYWTAERMRDAIPLDVGPAALAGGEKQRKAAIPFTRYEPNPYPPMHGKVFFSDGVFNYVCSGIALTSGNESVVWTAGHCVHQGPGAFYTNCAFVPQYRDNVRPHGTWTARRLMTTRTAIRRRLRSTASASTSATPTFGGRTHPPSRVELVYAPPDGGAPGAHEAAVIAPGESPDAWTFSVA